MLELGLKSWPRGPTMSNMSLKALLFWWSSCVVLTAALSGAATKFPANLAIGYHTKFFESWYVCQVDNFYVMMCGDALESSYCLAKNKPKRSVKNLWFHIPCPWLLASVHDAINDATLDEHWHRYIPWGGKKLPPFTFSLRTKKRVLYYLSSSLLQSMVAAQ